MDLEKEIQELIEMPTEPKSDWIRKFESASELAIAGAILHWQPKSDISLGPDHLVNKREAASIILQARLSSKVTNTMEELDSSASKVTLVGLLLAFIGVVVGVVQLYKS